MYTLSSINFMCTLTFINLMCKKCHSPQIRINNSCSVPNRRYPVSNSILLSTFPKSNVETKKVARGRGCELTSGKCRRSVKFSGPCYFYVAVSVVFEALSIHLMPSPTRSCYPLATPFNLILSYKPLN